jgi:DNA-binding CsgD family transcriptional regulator/tetratricopeptide (TPR) repeat protein
MGTPALVPRLRGREAEQRVLGEALDRVASGSLAVLLIEGEAGIGKTRLLKEGLAGAAARGMQVAAGGAEELERSRPFGLLAGAFGCVPASGDPRRAAIGALLSARGSSGKSPVTVTSDPGLQFRVVDAFGDLVEALALSGPVVIGLDDLQWADPSSSVTLAAMGRRLADLPVGIIGCFRPTPRPAEPDGAMRALEAAGARHLALSPLGTEAVSDLVWETVAAEPGPGLLAEIAGASGNPLFVTELLAALVQEGAIHVIEGRAEVDVATLPPTLRLTILRRLSFLPEDTLQVLQAASILGSGFSLTDLALISGRPGIGLTAALTEAIRAHVIEDDGVHLRFRHDLIRDSIYQDLPASLRQGLHRDAAVRLAHSGAPSLRVAEHFARGASEGDGEAIGWLTRAAWEAAPGSPAAAAGLLDQAVTLMRPADPDRDRLMAERAGHLMLAGRITDAETTCRRLLDRRHDPAIEGATRICLGHALLAQSRHRDGLAEMERAAESPLLTDAEQATARAWASFARLSLGDLDGAASAAGQAVSAASAAGDPMSASIATTALATISQLRGQFADALRISDDALRLADESLARQGQQYPVHIARGSILTQLDRLEEARATLHAGRRINEERGVRWPLPSFGVYLGIERFTAGEWDDALAELESSLELAEETGETYSVIPAHVLMSLIRFHRDDLSGAAAAVAAADRELADRDPPYHIEWAAWPRSLLQEASGQSARALTTMTAFWEQTARQGISVDCPVVGADLIRLAIADGDTRLARQVAEAVGDVASRNNLPWLRGTALRCQGLAENDVHALVAAAGAYADASRPLELALASEDAAMALVRQGDAERARPLLDQAIAVFERLGADRGLARANAILRRAGVRRGVRGPRQRPRFGWQSLTPTELTVSGLVADGLSNPQIGERLYISRRTVQTHLAHVFAKLDIASRAQLAAEVTRRRGGPLPGPISARWPTSLRRRGHMMRTWLPRCRARSPGGASAEPREEP